MLATWNAAKAQGDKAMPALFDAMDHVLRQQAKQIAIPRRFEATIKEIWSLQPRFEQRSGGRPFRLLEHPRFRAGCDFLDLRCRSGELEGELAGLADWWARFADAGPDEREAMLRPDEAPKKRKRSRGRGRKHAGDADGGPGAPRAPTPAPTRTRETRRRVRRAGQQPRPPAPPARPRRARRSRGCRATRVTGRVAELRDRAGRHAGPAARLRQRGRAHRHGACRRARCSRGCSPSSAASAGGAIPRGRATRRGRSTSICYYTAAAGCTFRR